MFTYTYQGLNRQGGNVSGVLEAESIQKAKHLLKAKGIYPISISEQPVNQGSFFSGRVRIDDLVVAIRELATLINSGIPLDECLSGLVSQMKANRLREIFTEIQVKIREGKSFSGALHDYPQYFPEMIVSLIRAGEESGTLELILERVADFMEKKLTLRNKIISIMTYPTLMVVVAFLVLFFILSFVAPTITKIFKEINLTLPVPTRVLIELSGFFKRAWIFFILLLAAAIYFFRKALRTDKGIQWFDRWRLRLPYLSDLFVKTDIAAFSRTLGTLLAGGVDILESFRISEKVIFSPHIKQEVSEIREFLAKGGSLSVGFQNARRFPYLVTQLVNAGEKSGNLPEMFSKAASIYEEEVTQKATRLVSFIEPVMILLMGVVVGFIVLAVLLPIFQVSQSVR